MTLTAVNPNPFGQPQVASYPHGVANPFVVAPNYSQPVAAGLGSIPTMTAVSPFGVVSPSVGGQVGMVNGRAWNVQQPAAPAQVPPPQQVNASWGQPATVNPFMVWHSRKMMMLLTVVGPGINFWALNLRVRFSTGLIARRV
jgi:hypothetical protein